MENPTIIFPGKFKVVGHVVVFERGSFRVEEFYIKGRHEELSLFGEISFIMGWQGEETRVALTRVLPFRVFNVV